MATITVRNIDEDLKLALRKQAAAHNRSMEEEARQILSRALASQHRKGLGTAIRAEVERLGGGLDFDLPKDEVFEPMSLGDE